MANLALFQVFRGSRFQLLRRHHLPGHVRRRLQPAPGRRRHRNRSADRIGRIRNPVGPSRPAAAPGLQLGLHVPRFGRLRRLLLLQGALPGLLH